MVNNNFSDKQVAFFITLGGDKPKKVIINMEKIIEPKNPIEELGIINALKNPEDIEQQIVDWCEKIKI